MLINSGQEARAFKLDLAPAVSAVQHAPAAVAPTLRAIALAAESQPSPPTPRNPGYSGLDIDLEDSQDDDDDAEDENPFPAEQRT